MIESKTFAIPPWVKVGKELRIDKNVILGYKPRRSIPDLTLTIGDGANIRSGTVLYAGSIIGKNLQMGHNAVIREENIIGDNFKLWTNSIVDYGCRIGNCVKIHSNCYVAQFTTIHDDVFLAPGVVIANDPHPGCPYSKKCMRGPIICKGAQIGVNVTILPFLTIGEQALVGAGSVLTHDVPPEMVVYGNPAKPIKSIYDLRCTQSLTDKPYWRK